MVFQAPPPPIHARTHAPAPAPLPPLGNCSAAIQQTYPVYVFVNTIKESAVDATATAQFSPDSFHLNPCVTISSDGTIDLTKYKTKTSIPIYFTIKQSGIEMAGNVVYPVPPSDSEFHKATIYSDDSGDDTIAGEVYNNSPDGLSHYYSLSVYDGDSGDYFVIDPKIQNQPPQNGLGTPLLIAIGIAGVLAAFGVYFVRFFRRRR